MRTAVVLTSFLAIAQATAKPDFTGEWVMDPLRTMGSGPVPAGPPAGVLPPGMVAEPRKIKHVNPVYPADAMRAGISGIVVIEAVISTSGRVQNARVVRSVPALDEAALDAVALWEYVPTRLNDIPVEVAMMLQVRFNLAGTTPPLGVPVATPTPWPSQPAGAVRPGMGRGFSAPEISLKQDAESLTMIRRFADVNEEITYRFDGQPSANKLPGTGGAIDNVYTYVSKWDGAKLVTTITWIGPQGPRARVETISIEGRTLTVQTSRPPTDPGTQPAVTTTVFSRKK